MKKLEDRISAVETHIGDLRDEVSENFGALRDQFVKVCDAAGLGEAMPTKEEMEELQNYVANLQWLQANEEVIPTEDEMRDAADYVANLQEADRT